jgi:alanine racemase
VEASARCTVEVDLGAIRHNVRRLRAAAPRAACFAVVKADAYGHGAVPVARAALEAGAEALCVATLAEAQELRAALGDGVRIIILFPLAPGEEREASGFEVVVSTPDVVERMRTTGLAYDVHVKVDTGMGRWGLTAADAGPIVADLLAGRLPGWRLRGISSHLATADDPDPRFVRTQLERFLAFTAKAPGVPRHLANSAGTLGHPATHLEAVRPGIALYGASPFGDEGADHGLRPAMRWTSSVQLVRRLAPGESSGYGRRFIAREETTVALVPVGYADGYLRRLSGRADVLIGGRRRRVIDPISMDQLTVVVDDSVRVGDPVVLLGEQQGERISADELARRAETLPQEILCAVVARPTRARRVVVGG